MLSKAIVDREAHFQPEARQVALLEGVVNQKSNANRQRYQADRSACQHITLPQDDEEESDWEVRLAHPGPDAEQQFAEKQFRYSVEQQLQLLSPIERTILVLYHQEERSYEQIALSLKLPIGTVRTPAAEY